MTTMSPTPQRHPSVGDKMTPETTALPDNVVIHEGKKYKVETQIIQHGTIWKVWQGTQAIFLSILSLGIGLAFQAWRDAIKNKWHNATTGEETKCFYERMRESPPEIQTTTKASELGATLQPRKESTKETPMNHLRTTRQPITKPPQEIPVDERIPMNDFLDFDDERIPMNEFIGDSDRDVIRDVKLIKSDVDVAPLEESVI